MNECECFVIKFNDGNYCCGNNTLSERVYHAQFFVRKTSAEKCIARLLERAENNGYITTWVKNSVLSGYKILTATINVKEE